MIQTVECIILSCDNCKKNYQDYNGFTIFVDDNQAREASSNDDWYREEGKDYCPDCYSLDDDDNLILKKIE